MRSANRVKLKKICESQQLELTRWNSQNISSEGGSPGSADGAHIRE